MLLAVPPDTTPELEAGLLALPAPACLSFLLAMSPLGERGSVEDLG